MVKQSKPRKKSKPAKKKPLLQPRSSSLSLTGGGSAGIGSPCQCDEGDDGFFYCYKRVQGRWVACRGPFETREECINVTNERCI